MSNDYLFGHEAMKPILSALGIDIDAKKFAMQHIQIELAHDMYPTVSIRCVPQSDLFEDAEALCALKGANVIINTTDISGLPYDSVEMIARREVGRAMRELFAASAKNVLDEYQSKSVMEGDGSSDDPHGLVEDDFPRRGDDYGRVERAGGVHKSRRFGGGRGACA
ncbi:MAG: hypothetical protein ACYTBJ_14895 [Planctomycetota bacterium]|jgi:hypothetical protein